MKSELTIGKNQPLEFHVTGRNMVIMPAMFNQRRSGDMAAVLDSLRGEVFPGYAVVSSMQGLQTQDPQKSGWTLAFEEKYLLRDGGEHAQAKLQAWAVAELDDVNERVPFLDVYKDREMRMLKISLGDRWYNKGKDVEEGLIERVETIIAAHPLPKGTVVGPGSSPQAVYGNIDNAFSVP
ncbi:hypothetical protein ACFL1B_01135 [Nanoarchaeota archaeon]